MSNYTQIRLPFVHSVILYAKTEKQYNLKDIYEKKQKSPSLKNFTVKIPCRQLSILLKTSIEKQ
jgi:hypothetical protein